MSKKPKIIMPNHYAAWVVRKALAASISAAEEMMRDSEAAANTQSTRSREHLDYWSGRANETREAIKAMKEIEIVEIRK